MTRLSGKSALVTGGNSGIGFGAAKRMIAEGAFVYITDRDQEKLYRSVGVLGDQTRAFRADAVVFRASDEASFIELTVDGGQTQIYAGHN